MSVYHQMGYQTDNLMYELHGFAGAVLSPVNYALDELVERTNKLRFIGRYEVLFDPQLYEPTARRGHLSNWKYYPKELDTADTSDPKFWEGVSDAIITECRPLRAEGICSPACIPREFTLDYFAGLVETGTYLAKQLATNDYHRPIQTAVVGLHYLSAQPARPMEVASVLSRSPCAEIYLVLGGDKGDTDPRREMQDVAHLKSAMRLIAALEKSGHRVIVAFTSSELVLWKAAGASHVGTGKNFNVRRFTSTRFEEGGPKGGQQVPYWFEESLLTFLRPADVARLHPLGFLDDTIQANRYARDIVDQIAKDPNEAWIALGQKLFLTWAIGAEGRLSSRSITAEKMLATALAGWKKLEATKPRIFMAEPENQGTWLTVWKTVLEKFQG
jgi:hypothetical protein